MVAPADPPNDNKSKTEEDAFSVNDWDIEKGIFNLVISLVQQRAQRMDATVARQSVVEFLNSLISGLKNTEEDVNDKIQAFIKQQREEDK